MRQKTCRDIKISLNFSSCVHCKTNTELEKRERERFMEEQNGRNERLPKDVAVKLKSDVPGSLWENVETKIELFGRNAQCSV